MNIEELFEEYEAVEIDEPDKLIVKISGCESCNSCFYLSYKTFIRLHLLTKRILEKRISANEIRNYLEGEIDKRCKTGDESYKNRVQIKSFGMSSKNLKKLNLKSGRNEIVFKLNGRNQKLSANIYFWNKSEKIIISDIDGTITKSDVRGHLYGLMGVDWTHNGVAGLYEKLVQNGYKILYLTTRPIVQSGMTRFYLQNIKQGDSLLPSGPILHSIDGVFSVLYREIITRDPQNFKIACLKKIETLFEPENPYIAGFGNKINDVIAYKTLNIPESKIFTISPEGNIRLEISKSVGGTHKALNEFVEQMFPRIHADCDIEYDHRYSDSSFWKLPMEKFL